VFVNDGEVSLSACFLPTDDRLAVSAEGGANRVRPLRVTEIRQACEKGR
jgi:hypothetical protein